MEYWGFLSCYCDLSKKEGLQKLENYLANINESLSHNPIPHSRLNPTPVLESDPKIMRQETSPVSTPKMGHPHSNSHTGMPELVSEHEDEMKMDSFSRPPARKLFVTNEEDINTIEDDNSPPGKVTVGNSEKTLEVVKKKEEEEMAEEERVILTDVEIKQIETVKQRDQDERNTGTQLDEEDPLSFVALQKEQKAVESRSTEKSVDDLVSQIDNLAIEKSVTESLNNEEEEIVYKTPVKGCEISDVYITGYVI